MLSSRTIVIPGLNKRASQTSGLRMLRFRHFPIQLFYTSRLRVRIFQCGIGLLCFKLLELFNVDFSTTDSLREGRLLLENTSFGTVFWLVVLLWMPTARSEKRRVGKECR